jgi:hypothetical protein
MASIITMFQWRTEGGFGVFKQTRLKFRSFEEAELKYVVFAFQKLRKFYYMKLNFLYQIITA